jgi:hypothetical protein
MVSQTNTNRGRRDRRGRRTKKKKKKKNKIFKGERIKGYTCAAKEDTGNRGLCTATI